MILAVLGFAIRNVVADTLSGIALSVEAPYRIGDWVDIEQVARGKVIEIGTSAGYSTLWLALACRTNGRFLTTYEILEEKVRLAAQTFQQTQTADVITLVAGDAREHLKNMNDIAFCFLDAEKEVYADCYELVVPKLVPGGLLIADNAINHREMLEPMLQRALSDGRVDALIVPIGSGVLLCRKIS